MSANDEVPPPALVSDIEACDASTNDPPPPYPSRSRRTRGLAGNRNRRPSQPIHTQLSSTDSHSDYEAVTSPFPLSDEGEPDENTPFLSPHQRRPNTRPRSISHASTLSVAPSLAHTVLSLFQTEDDDGGDYEERGASELESLPEYVQPRGFFSAQSWKRYFRPLVQKVYYLSLFHLLALNFPYALIAWIFLFVFTLVCSVMSKLYRCTKYMIRLERPC